jgi:hypothetical protein
MTNKLKFTLLGMALMVAGSSLAPLAKADEWDKKTIVTFSEPVQLPGKVLQAGTYVFKLAESDSDRDIVQVFSEDQTQLITTILAIPDYSVKTPDKSVFNLEERPSGGPEAIKSWFYPGDNYGYEFVYPKQAMQAAAKSEPPAPVTTTSENTRPAPPPVQPAAEDNNPQPEPTITAQEEQETVVAQEMPVQTEQAPESMPQSLPQTAGNFALLPMMGAGLLVGGATLVRLASQRS